MILDYIAQKIITSIVTVSTVSAATVTPVVPVETPADTTPQVRVAAVEVVVAEQPTPEEVKEEIIRQAAEYGVNVNDALRIAKCESTFKYNAANSHSSAKGVYQFIDGTWDWVGAEGHQYDYKENITQFMKWYPRYPQWWECK